jgi:hypothetical protein
MAVCLIHVMSEFGLIALFRQTLAVLSRTLIQASLVTTLTLFRVIKLRVNMPHVWVAYVYDCFNMNQKFDHVLSNMHFMQQHRTGLAKKIWLGSSKDEDAKWIMERKR